MNARRARESAHSYTAIRKEVLDDNDPVLVATQGLAPSAEVTLKKAPPLTFTQTPMRALPRFQSGSTCKVIRGFFIGSAEDQWPCRKNRLRSPGTSVPTEVVAPDCCRRIDLRPKPVRALIQHGDLQWLSASTRQNRFSMLPGLCTGLGNASMLEAPRCYGPFERTNRTTEDRSWSARAVGYRCPDCVT